MTSESAYLFIILITIVNKLALIALFLFQRKNQRFNRLLAAIIASALPVMVANLMHYWKIEWFIERVYLSSAIGVLYYPLCVLLFYECLKMKLLKGWKFYLYLWGPVAYYVVLTLLHWLVFDQETIADFIYANLYYDWDNRVSDLVNIPMGLYFVGHVIYFIIFLIKTHRLTKDYASTHMIRRRFRFVLLFVVTLILISILMAIYTAFDFDREVGDMVMVPMASNVLTLLLVFFVFDGRLVSEEPEFVLIKKQNSRGGELIAKREMPSKVDLETQKAAVIDYFEHREDYHESDFTIQRLAEHLSISAHQLSFLINSEFGQNFSDFVADFRIEKAKDMIENGDLKNLTVEAIGQSVGYKSKSTFFNHFKRKVGKTPVQFRNSLVKEKV